MSCSDLSRRRFPVALAALAASALSLAGCQVRPLYAESTGAVTKTASIAVDPVGSRVAQQVRNDLIFQFSRGAGEPSNPAYRLSINVQEQSIGLFVSSQTDTATAGDMKITVRYVLTDAATQKVIKKGERVALASFDLPPQEFAKIRSTRDAEDRAAHTAAGMVSADVTAALAAR